MTREGNTCPMHLSDECAIHRCHTTRNRPQQNGVAERANRTMADDISAMLFEAKLPPSHWGEGLSANPGLELSSYILSQGYHSLLGLFHSQTRCLPFSCLGMPGICLH